MVTRDFETRSYDCFVSYGSEDVGVAASVHDFLIASGLSVFFDQERLKAGRPVLETLAQAMADSKSCIVLLSKRSIEKDYVRFEIESASQQAVTHREGFRFVGALLESFDPSEHVQALGNLTWLDLDGGDLTIHSARKALLSIRRSETVAKPDQAQIYVSCSWRDHEPHPRDWILQRFADKGAFLVGDSRDQRRYGEDGAQRIRRILSSCAGFLAIYPARRDSQKTPAEQYKYFPTSLRLPVSLASHSGYCVDPDLLPPTLGGPWTAIPDADSLPDIDTWIVDFLDDVGCRAPHAFLATDFKRSLHRNEAARDVIEHLMGMACKLGKEVTGGRLREQLIDAIREANIVIADIACSLSNEQELAININTCIEAGIAMSAGRPLLLTSIDPTKVGAATSKTASVPFFFKNHEIEWYANDLEFLAATHKIARLLRRRIINDEL